MTVAKLFTRTTGTIGALLAVFALYMTSAQAEGDIMAGRKAAQKCEVCHGLDGVAFVVEAPNLSGQKETYLIKQLTSFKTGERQNEMMSVVAPTLTDKEIEDLAAYYAAVIIKVEKVPGQ